MNKLFILISLMLSAFLVMTPSGLAQEKPWDNYIKGREQIAKQIDLNPKQAEKFIAVQKKFIQQYKELSTAILTSERDLKKVLSQSKPDKARVHELVSKIITAQDKLFNAFKAHRDEELALMTPMQRGKYLVSLRGSFTDKFNK